MPDSLRRFTRRAAHYDLLDGTGELSFGITMLGFLLAMRLAAGLSVWLWLLIVEGAIAVLWAVCHYGTRYIRSRLTWRRAGYIAPRKRFWMYAGLLAFVVGASAALFVLRGTPSPVSVPLLVALLMSAIFVGNWVRFRVQRFLAMAAASAAIGVALQFLEPGAEAGTLWFVALLSVAMLVSGGLTLWRYGRRPPPQREAE